MANSPSSDELAALRERLKAGKVTREDLQVLADLAERTEQAAKQLRAALAE
jgi:hypothetical protein